MSNQWPVYRIVGGSSGLLTIVGFCGLWICKMTREWAGMTEHQFMETTLGSVAVWSLSGCFTIGLFILFPVSLYLQHRAGIPSPGLRVPVWIAGPLIAILILLTLLILAGVAFRIVFPR